MAYSEKQIRITISVEGEVHTFAGFACAVRVKRQGAPELPSLEARIWGLSEARLAQLTMLSFNALSLKENRIIVEPGEGGNLSKVFEGEITNSVPDFNAAPSPVLNIEAITAAYAKREASPPIAVNGAQSAASLSEGIAREAGFTFHNEGVNASIQNAVINGDPVSKLMWIANTVGADLVFDDQEVSLIPANGSRGPAAAVTLISPETGQIGYPSFDSMGIQCRTLFRPDLRIGGTVQIQSRLPRATGAWKLYALEHNLTAYLPGGGKWETLFSGTWLGD